MLVVTVLAHPLLEAGGLPLPPLALAAIGVLAVLGATLLPRGRPSPPPAVRAPRLGAGAVAGRAAGLLVLVTAIAAGRSGRNDVTANIAPALIVGVGWPLLVAVSAVAGRVWERLDPWDTLARAAAPLTRDDSDGAGAPVWWALPSAAALVWYLAAFRQALLPRSVATALAAYTVVTVAGCVAVGRREWLQRVEIVGLLLGWIGLIRRRRLVAWAAPDGAAVVLGVVAGGLLFGMLRYSRLLNPLIFAVPEVPAEWVGVAVLGAVGATVAWAGDRVTRTHNAPGAAAAALVPMVAGVVLAAALVRGQLVLALQLLPDLVSDPLGRGWDLFGTSGLWGTPRPLNPALLEAVQAALVVLGGVVGGIVARHRAILQTSTPGHARHVTTAAAGMICVLVAAGVLAATAV